MVKQSEVGLNLKSQRFNWPCVLFLVLVKCRAIKSWTWVQPLLHQKCKMEICMSLLKCIPGTEMLGSSRTVHTVEQLWFFEFGGYEVLYDLWSQTGKFHWEWICSLVSTGLLKGVFLESGSPEVTFSFSSAVVSSEARLSDSLISCFEKLW